MAKKIFRLGAKKLPHRSLLLLDLTAPNNNDRNAGTLSHDEFRGGGNFVGSGRDGGLELVPVPVRQSSLVLDGFQPGDSNRDIDRTDSPRTAETIADNNGRVLPSPPLNFVSDRPGRAVRVSGQQGDSSYSCVGLVHPGIGADKPVMGLHDQRPPAHSDDLTAFAQNNFDQRWLFVELFAQFNSAHRGLDVVQADCSILGLGNNLLGNHQDIIIQQAELLPRTSIADQSADGIALSNFTDPLKTDQFKPLHKTPMRFFSAT